MPDIIEIVIDDNVTYSSHPDHRNKSYKKSQWTIEVDDEVNCFRNCYTEEWLVDQNGWGLYIVGTNVHYLGLDQTHMNEVFLAKFVDGNNNKKWHGYPVDHQRSIADIPDVAILNAWLGSSLLSPSKIRKISRGQPCSL